MDDAKRQEIFLDLFIHPGWKMIMQEMEEARDVLVETAWTIEEANEMAHRRGQIEQLNAFLAYETVIRQTIDEKVVGF